MLKLYNAAHSTCSQKVRICLAEKGLPFEDIKLDLGKAKEHLRPDYLKINPNGVVPTLVDGDDIIIDSSVICEYLEEKYPDVPLLRRTIPPAPRAYACVDASPKKSRQQPCGCRPSAWQFLPRYEGPWTERPSKASSPTSGESASNSYRRMGPNGFKQEDVQASIEQMREHMLSHERHACQRPVAAGRAVYPSPTSS